MSDVRRKRRDRPGWLAKPRAKARDLGLGVLAASVVLLGPAAAPCRAAQGAAPSGEIPLIYQKHRSFRIPFNLSAAQKSRIDQVILLVSQDSGETWKPVSKTDVTHPAFAFRADHDGEYWFTVQTHTVDGKVSPDLDSPVEPKMKVIIDTAPPSLVLEPERRRGSMVAVRWEVKDEYLDLRSLALEYQVEGVGVWNRVPIPPRRLKRIGAQSWDAGTAEALRVRMTVADKAGNVTPAVLSLPEGAGSPPEASVPGSAEDTGPPAIEAISGPARPRITAGEGFTPVDEEPPPSRPSPSPRTTPPRTRPATAGARARSRPTPPEWDRDPGLPPARPPAAALAAAASAPARTAAEAVPDSFPTPGSEAAPDAGFGDASPGGGAAPASGSPSVSADPPSTRGGAGPSGNTLLVESPRFKLQYAVDDAGPNGPATVELWITQDGGRTWIRRGEDPDRTSPIDVDLGGEGTYGICLVARSAAGLGDQPPAPGDPPQTWVEVDASPPVVQLDPVQVGTGLNSGKVAISWRATDLHLAARPVALFWRPDQPGAGWQPLADGQESTGRFIWTVP